MFLSQYSNRLLATFMVILLTLIQDDWNHGRKLYLHLNIRQRFVYHYYFSVVRSSPGSLFLFSYATRAGSPQQREPITVGPHYLTHPATFPVGGNRSTRRKRVEIRSYSNLSESRIGRSMMLPTSRKVGFSPQPSRMAFTFIAPFQSVDFILFT